MRVREVVNDDRNVSGIGERYSGMRSYVAKAARKEYFWRFHK